MTPEAEPRPADAGSPPPALKPPVRPDALLYRELLDGPFWRRIPAYAGVTDADFLDHGWQARHSITNPAKLLAAVKGLVSDEFLRDAEAGFRLAPMSVRVSPYLLSLIDWEHPYDDPLRIQFIPVASSRLPDHPYLDLDSLHERKDMPVPGLTHRYPDKALFLALDTCPVYCRFCTRSYAVGIDTEEVTKFHLRVNPERWQATFAYIASRPELEDIVVSGGDSYQLRAEQITHIGEALLAIPHVRRFRYATKGLAVMPQKILTDHEWTDAVTRIVDKGRKLHKEVVIHTHFNHPNEITVLTKTATDKLFERGITIRNQTVLQRRVNDTTPVQLVLNKRLVLRQRAPLLHLHARPGQRGGGPAHHPDHRPFHREGFAGRDLRLQHAAGGGRCARWRWQARCPLLRALRPGHRHLGVHQPVGTPRTAVLLLRPHRSAARGRATPLG